MNLRLARKNREVNPESWDDLYGHLVTKEFRKKYNADKVESVVNNYLKDPINEEYIAEMKKMQDYREECKAKAKKKLEI